MFSSAPPTNQIPIEDDIRRVFTSRPDSVIGTNRESGDVICVKQQECRSSSVASNIHFEQPDEPNNQDRKHKPRVTIVISERALVIIKQGGELNYDPFRHQWHSARKRNHDEQEEEAQTSQLDQVIKSPGHESTSEWPPPTKTQESTCNSSAREHSQFETIECQLSAEDRAPGSHSLPFCERKTSPQKKGNNRKKQLVDSSDSSPTPTMRSISDVSVRCEDHAKSHRGEELGGSLPPAPQQQNRTQAATSRASLAASLMMMIILFWLTFQTSNYRHHRQPSIWRSNNNEKPMLIKANLNVIRMTVKPLKGSLLVGMFLRPATGLEIGQQVASKRDFDRDRLLSVLANEDNATTAASPTRATSSLARDRLRLKRENASSGDHMIESSSSSSPQDENADYSNSNENDGYSAPVATNGEDPYDDAVSSSSSSRYELNTTASDSHDHNQDRNKNGLYYENDQGENHHNEKEDGERVELNDNRTRNRESNINGNTTSRYNNQIDPHQNQFGPKNPNESNMLNSIFLHIDKQWQFAEFIIIIVISVILNLVTIIGNIMVLISFKMDRS